MRSPGRSRSLLTVTVAALVLGLPAPAEIPAGQMLALLGRNDPRHPELSPILGCMALRSGVLARVRFCGPYAATPDPAFPRHSHLKTWPNHPQDAIAGVVQRFWLSPDGVSLTPNELRKDPIGEIANEQGARRRGESSQGGLVKIHGLLAAAANYRRQVETILAHGYGAPETARDALESAGRDFREAAYHLLAHPGRKGSHEGDGKPAGLDGKASHFDAERRQDSILLQEAVLSEVADFARKYPPFIVENAMSAYAWMVADDVRELFDAFGGDSRPGFLERPKPGEPTPACDQAWYQAHLQDFLARLGRPAADPPTAEEYAIFLGGYEASLPVTVETVTSRTTRFGDDPYPDCGETSLRNFFIKLFFRDGRLDRDLVDHLEQRFPPGEDKATGAHPLPGQLDGLKGYFHTYSTLGSQHSAAAHLDWSRLVSSRNLGDHDPVPITYRTKKTHNLAGIGQENMLNLIAHLLPDAVLAAPWPSGPKAKLAMAAGKWDHLCAAFTTGARDLTWTVDDRHAIPDSYVELDFQVNRSPAFSWDFQERHFELAPAFSSEGPRWPRPAGGQPGSFLALAWRKRLGIRPPLLPPAPTPDSKAGPGGGVTSAGLLNVAPAPMPVEQPEAGRVLEQPYEVYGEQLEGLDGALKAVDYLVRLDSRVMRPVLRQILNTRFPADAWALERLGRYLYDPEERPGTDDRLVQALLPLEFLQELPPERKNDLLGRIVQDDEHPVRFAIRLLQVHGADLDAKDAQGLPCVVRALMAGLPQSALNLLQAGANADSRGPGGATLLHLALRVDWDAVEYGQLPDDEEAEELAPCASLLVQLLKLGVNPAAADDEGITPLQEAEAKGDEDAAGVLRKALEPARPGEGKAGGPVAGAASGSP